jgi:hypothetical protein
MSSAPLNREQKRELSQLYRRAYKRAGAGVDGLTIDDWRRSEVARATGKLGLRCCTQSDSCACQAHVWELLGEPGRALYWLQRGQGEGQRQAMAVLERTCRECGLPLSYPAAVCRRQNRGLELAHASERQLWSLIYTVRNRAYARRKRADSSAKSSSSPSSTP